MLEATVYIFCPDLAETQWLNQRKHEIPLAEP